MKKLPLLLFFIVTLLFETGCQADQADSDAFVWAPAEDAVEISDREPAGSILMKNDFAKVSVYALNPSSTVSNGKEIFAYGFTCENNSDTALTFNIDYLAINGYSLFYSPSYGTIEVAPGESDLLYLWYSYSALANIAATFEDIKTIEFTLSAYDTAAGNVSVTTIGEEAPKTINDYAHIVIYPQGGDKDNVVLPERAVTEVAETLIDTDDLMLIFTGIQPAENDSYQSDTIANYFAHFYIENRTEDILTFNFDNTTINNISCVPYNANTYDVAANRRAEIVLEFYLSDKEAVDTISEFSFALSADRFSTGEIIDDLEAKTFTVTNLQK